MELLRAASLDAEHVLDEALGGASDTKLAEIARREDRAIVTLDLDFADVRRFPPAEYSGVIVLRPDSQSHSRLIHVFNSVIALLSEEPLARRLWIVDESGVRVRE
ncbi:MAG: DUF5615 family PIN-like protein [Planctomycetes bacterium]|nr:DUF5615 family PIN-like protein [Planctomycetota bacterium]